MALAVCPGVVVGGEDRCRRRLHQRIDPRRIGQVCDPKGWHRSNHRTPRSILLIGGCMNTPIESKSQERALTTTSFAVLSVLSLRDHSTYDIIRQMRLSMHYMWPRAESNVYAEPRRLVEAGLATAREEWNGQRRRTVYSITEAGRAALAEWIAVAQRPPAIRERGAREGDVCRERHARRSARVDPGISAVTRPTPSGNSVGIADRYAAGEGEYPRPVRAVGSRLSPGCRATGDDASLGDLGRAGRRRTGRLRWPPMRAGGSRRCVRRANGFRWMTIRCAS